MQRDQPPDAPTKQDDIRTSLLASQPKHSNQKPRRVWRTAQSVRFASKLKSRSIFCREGHVRMMDTYSKLIVIFGSKQQLKARIVPEQAPYPRSNVSGSESFSEFRTKSLIGSFWDSCSWFLGLSRVRRPASQPTAPGMLIFQPINDRSNDRRTLNCRKKNSI